MRRRGLLTLGAAALGLALTGPRRGRRVQFPLLLDREGLEHFGLRGHPNTVLIDRKGRLGGFVRGERDWQASPRSG